MHRIRPLNTCDRPFIRRIEAIYKVLCVMGGYILLATRLNGPCMTCDADSDTDGN
jgi:hypothetical protein